MEKNSYPGSYYQPLFDLMRNEHGTILTESSLTDIIDVVSKMLNTPTGPRWVKASERLAKAGKQVFARDQSGRKTVGYFSRSNLASDTIDTFYSMVGGFYIRGNDYKSLEWLDESTPAGREEDAVEVMLWAFTNIREWDKDAKQIYLYDGKTFPVSKLYGIFKKEAK